MATTAKLMVVIGAKADDFTRAMAIIGIVTELTMVLPYAHTQGVGKYLSIHKPRP